jgi:predicted protein tyrosine phosphatase
MQRQYLFLCHAGEKRSPTAASVAREIAEYKGLDIKMSFGSADMIAQFAPEAVLRHLKIYEKIFVMSEDITRTLTKIGISKDIITCLDISEGYERNDQRLREILRDKLEGLI